MSLQERFGRFVFNLIPADNAIAYRVVRHYVDRFNGDNDSNPAANGEHRFLLNELRNREVQTVFDVGANVGDWAEFALRVKPHIELHCFEPSAVSFARLATRGFSQNVRLNQLGLGDADGIADLIVVGEASGLNSLYVRESVAAGSTCTTETIMIGTVDSYCARNSIEGIDLVKIDVEGHELAVMKGMTRVLSERRVKAIQFEYGGCALDAGITLRDIWQLLEPQGFEFFKLHYRGMRRVREYRRDLETFRYSNWIARLA
jgi:FkbM family methyltransferase